MFHTVTFIVFPYETRIRRLFNLKHLIDEFGEQLMKEVRDRSIRYTIAHQKGVSEETIKEIVDITIHSFLNYISNEENVKFLVEQEDICELSDGLSGELYTSDGWIERFSSYK